jgi:hypothetical protein
LKGKKGRIVEKEKICNGAARIYASFLTVVHVYIQNVEFVCAEGKGRPWKKDSWSVEKIAIRDAP